MKTDGLLLFFLFSQLAVTEIEAHNSNHRLEICPSSRSIIRCCIIIYLAVLSQQSVTVYLAPIIKANGERVSRRDERPKELRSKLGPANETFAPLSPWCQENKDPVVGASFNQLVSVCVCVCVKAASSSFWYVDSFLAYANHALWFAGRKGELMFLSPRLSVPCHRKLVVWGVPSYLNSWRPSLTI